VALILRARGVDRVRPLAGGFYAWRDRGYPTTSLPAEVDRPAAPSAVRGDRP